MSENDVWIVCASCEGKICSISGRAEELGKTGYLCPNRNRVVKIVMEVS